MIAAPDARSPGPVWQVIGTRATTSSGPERPGHRDGGSPVTGTGGGRRRRAHGRRDTGPTSVGGVSEFDGLPVLRSPVAVAAFEGWNDAADASTAAVEHLEQVWSAKTVAELDPEEFYDFQVNRPTVSHAEGDERRIEWPTTRFAVASPPGSDSRRGADPRHRAEHPVAHVLPGRAGAVPQPRGDPGRAARRVAGRRAVHPVVADQRQRVGQGRPGAVRPHPQPVRGTDRHRRGAARRLPHAPSWTRCRSGCTCRTTRATRPARRRRWPCCTGSRRCSTCPYPWPIWPRSRPSGRRSCAPRPSRTPSWPSTCASSRSGPATTSPRCPATRSRSSSSATCAAAAVRPATAGPTAGH